MSRGIFQRAAREIEVRAKQPPLGARSSVAPPELGCTTAPAAPWPDAPAARARRPRPGRPPATRRQPPACGATGRKRITAQQRRARCEQKRHAVDARPRRDLNYADVGMLLYPSRPQGCPTARCEAARLPAQHAAVARARGTAAACAAGRPPHRKPEESRPATHCGCQDLTAVGSAK
jgi:hypothetical protein